MKLIPFPREYLRQDEPLPFGLRAADGRLLLSAGHKVEHLERLREMLGQPLFADAQESADWFRRLAAAMDERIRRGDVLGQVAAARPDAQAREAPPLRPLSLSEEWAEIIARLDGALRDARSGGDWRSRLLSVHVRARQMVERRTDASLYHLVFEAAHNTIKYSAKHALLTMLICEQAAPLLGWSQAWTDSLGRAALVMNVAMQRLQDQLAADQRPPSTEMKLEIETHAERGVQLLQAAGWADALCLDVVRLHHGADLEVDPLASQSPARQLARLLRRVDIFAAKISLRAARPPLSPVQAAREACLGCSGTPDEIGAALLRAVGLYPPGSFVEMAGGEIGIVVARGRRANLPYVAALISSSGSVIAEPMLRDTLDRRYAVKSAVPPSTVKVRPPHERLLAMR